MSKVSTKTQTRRQILSTERDLEELRKKRMVSEKTQRAALNQYLLLATTVDDAIFVFNHAEEKTTLEYNAWEAAIIFLRISKDAGEDLIAILCLGFTPTQKSWGRQLQLKDKAALIIPLLDDIEVLSKLYDLNPDKLLPYTPPDPGPNQLIRDRFKKIIDGFTSLDELEATEKKCINTSLWRQYSDIIPELKEWFGRANGE